jgi:hypothetical protein
MKFHLRFAVQHGEWSMPFGAFPPYDLGRAGNGAAFFFGRSWGVSASRIAIRKILPQSGFPPIDKG